MTYEIERKFLLDDVPRHVVALDASVIRQGYLASTDDVEIRVRARAGDHLLTVKEGHGEVRREVTIPLSADQFEQLWALTEGRRIRKRRRVASLNHQAEVDVEVEVEVDEFDGALSGLVIAEVEFASQDDSRAFQPPDWFGREVTDDDRYRNAALAQRSSVPPTPDPADPD